METDTPSPNETLALLQRMDKFFETYPPAKAERMLWHWTFLCAKKDFSTLTEEKRQEFADFFEQIEELTLALEKINKAAGVLKRDDAVIMGQLFN